MCLSIAHSRAVPLRVLWAVLFAASLAAAIVVAGVGTWQLWVFFVLPDVAVLGLMGGGLEKGQMHPRAVPLYNALHALPGPLLLLGASVALGATPWIAGALGWLAHVAMDRAAGYTLRTRDGFRAPDRREEIVATAAELLEAEGEAALTMRRLGEAVGMRAPSLYKHLPDKAALEAALAERGLREMGRALARAKDLPALTRAYRAWAAKHPALYRVATDRPLPRERLPEGLEAGVAAQIVALAGDEARARALFAFAHGMVSLEAAGRFPPGADLDAAWAAGLAIAEARA